MAQKLMNIGMLVKRAKKSQVNRPPPTLRDRRRGTIAIRETRRIFEKLSLPAESAGRGPFLIAAY